MINREIFAHKINIPPCFSDRAAEILIFGKVTDKDENLGFFPPYLLHCEAGEKTKSFNFHYRFEGTPPFNVVAFCADCARARVFVCLWREGSQAARSHTCSARLASFMFYYETPVLK